MWLSYKAWFGRFLVLTLSLKCCFHSHFIFSLFLVFLMFIFFLNNFSVVKNNELVRYKSLCLVLLEPRTGSLGSRHLGRRICFPGHYISFKESSVAVLHTGKESSGLQFDSIYSSFLGVVSFVLRTFLDLGLCRSFGDSKQFIQWRMIWSTTMFQAAVSFQNSKEA